MNVGGMESLIAQTPLKDSRLLVLVETVVILNINILKMSLITWKLVIHLS